MSDQSSIIEIEQLKAEIERLKAIYDHDSAAICENHAEISKRMKEPLIWAQLPLNAKKKPPSQVS